MAREETGPSLVVPVLLVVFTVLIAIALAQITVTVSGLKTTNRHVSAAVTELAKTDLIACSFINADTATRRAQSVNQDALVSREAVYVANTGTVIALFRSARALKARTTAAQRAASASFAADLRSQQDVWEATIRTQRKNIKLARALAAKAELLAQRLHC